MKLTCHCGAVELDVTLSDGLKTARRCDCSFCRRRGAIAVTAPLDGVKIVRGEDRLTLYQWGTGTAKLFHPGRSDRPSPFWPVYGKIGPA